MPIGGYDAVLRIGTNVDTSQLVRQISSVSSRIPPLRLNVQNSAALGRITGEAQEFNRSLQAANARVVAFGASAGAMYSVARGIREITKATVEVEKALADINVVLGLSSETLGKFSGNLFQIANDTGQSFKVAADAALEFSRQGLTLEQTLKRTNDALILTRLSGLEVADSVKAITAVLNGFNDATLDSTKLINKLATVDLSFAVSAADLATGFQRVGSSAKDTGVELDSLIGLITATQQITARGGAVIGNSFKSIFTRLQRSSTLETLKQFNIEIEDSEGNILSSDKLLQNLANTYKDLDQQQKNYVVNLAAGLFQANQFRAILGDLAKENSLYARATQISATATDEAQKRNLELNKTLSASLNEIGNNLTEVASAFGQFTVKPVIDQFNTIIRDLTNVFGEGSKFEISGFNLGEGLLKGLGNYLSGPGLATIGVLATKLFANFGGFAVRSFTTILEGLSSQFQTQQAINNVLAQQPRLQEAVARGALNQVELQNSILNALRSQSVEYARQGQLFNAAQKLIARGDVVNKGGSLTLSSRGRTRAGGLIPESVQTEERLGALQGGYTPGDIKPIEIPRLGKVYYNTAETVKKFPQFDQPAIMPPRESKAGQEYKRNFEKAHGFNPFASHGIVPNFNAFRGYPERDNNIPNFASLAEGIPLKFRPQRGLKRGSDIHFLDELEREKKKLPDIQDQVARFLQGGDLSRGHIVHREPSRAISGWEELSIVIPRPANSLYDREANIVMAVNPKTGDAQMITVKSVTPGQRERGNVGNRPAANRGLVPNKINKYAQGLIPNYVVGGARLRQQDYFNYLTRSRNNPEIGFTSSTRIVPFGERAASLRQEIRALEAIERDYPNGSLRNELKGFRRDRVENVSEYLSFRKLRNTLVPNPNISLEQRKLYLKQKDILKEQTKEKSQEIRYVRKATVGDERSFKDYLTTSGLKRKANVAVDSPSIFTDRSVSPEFKSKLLSISTAGSELNNFIGGASGEIARRVKGLAADSVQRLVRLSGARKDLFGEGSIQLKNIPQVKQKVLDLLGRGKYVSVGARAFLSALPQEGISQIFNQPKYFDALGKDYSLKVALGETSLKDIFGGILNKKEADLALRFAHARKHNLFYDPAPSIAKEFLLEGTQFSNKRHEIANSRPVIDFLKRNSGSPQFTKERTAFGPAGEQRTYTFNDLVGHIREEDLRGSITASVPKVFERVNERLANEQLAIMKERNAAFPTVPHLSKETDRVKILRNEASLIKEGERMRHCVGGYGDFCRNVNEKTGLQRSLIVSTGTATAELNPVIKKYNLAKNFSVRRSVNAKRGLRTGRFPSTQRKLTESDISTFERVRRDNVEDYLNYRKNRGKNLDSIDAYQIRGVGNANPSQQDIESIRDFVRQNGLIPNFAIPFNPQVLRQGLTNFRRSNSLNRVTSTSPTLGADIFEAGYGNINIPRGTAPSPEAIFHELGHVFSGVKGEIAGRLRAERVANTSGLQLIREAGGSRNDAELFKLLARENIKGYKLNEFENELRKLRARTGNIDPIGERNPLKDLPFGALNAQDLRSSNAIKSQNVRDLIKDIGPDIVRRRVKQLKLNPDSYYNLLGSPAYSKGAIPNFVFPTIKSSSRINPFVSNEDFRPDYFGLRDIFKDPKGTLKRLPFRLAGGTAALLAGKGASILGQLIGGKKGRSLFYESQSVISAGRFMAGLGGIRQINLPKGVPSEDLIRVIGATSRREIAEAAGVGGLSKKSALASFLVGGLGNTIGAYVPEITSQGKLRIRDSFDFGKNSLDSETGESLDFSGGLRSGNTRLTAFLDRIFKSLGSKSERLFGSVIRRSESIKSGPLKFTLSSSRPDKKDSSFSSSTELSVSGADKEFNKYGKPFLTEVNFEDLNLPRGFLSKGLVPNYAAFDPKVLRDVLQSRGIFNKRLPIGERNREQIAVAMQMARGDRSLAIELLNTTGFRDSFRQYVPSFARAASFNLGKLQGFQSLLDKNKYVEQLGLPLLGTGSGRRTFDIGGGNVLKLAGSNTSELQRALDIAKRDPKSSRYADILSRSFERGSAQNLVEGNPALDSFRDILPAVRERGQFGSFLISERVRPFRKDNIRDYRELEGLLKTDLDGLQEGALASFRTGSVPKFAESQAVRRIYELFSNQKFNLHAGDLSLQNFGIRERGVSRSPVILDIGFTNDLLRLYANGYVPRRVGDKVKLTAAEIGRSQFASAVKVKSQDVVSANKTPHITLGVNRGIGGKPVHSNFIKDFEKMDPIELEAVLKQGDSFYGAFLTNKSREKLLRRVGSVGMPETIAEHMTMGLGTATHPDFNSSALLEEARRKAAPAIRRRREAEDYFGFSHGSVPNFAPSPLQYAAVRYKNKLYESDIHFSAFRKVRQANPELQGLSEEQILAKPYAKKGYTTESGDFFDEERARANFGLRTSLDLDINNRFANGRIPNFVFKGVQSNIAQNALSQAITREINAGVPPSLVRVGSSPKLASPVNPSGFGVYNLRDEPTGLHQGITRVANQGLNPKTAGIPNFAPLEFNEGSFKSIRERKLIEESFEGLRRSVRGGSISISKALEQFDKIAKGSEVTSKSLNNFKSSIIGIDKRLQSDAARARSEGAKPLRTSFQTANERYPNITSLVPLSPEQKAARARQVEDRVINLTNKSIAEDEYLKRVERIKNPPRVIPLRGSLDSDFEQRRIRAQARDFRIGGVTEYEGRTYRSKIALPSQQLSPVSVETNYEQKRIQLQKEINEKKQLLLTQSREERKLLTPFAKLESFKGSNLGGINKQEFLNASREIRLSGKNLTGELRQKFLSELKEFRKTGLESIEISALESSASRAGGLGSFFGKGRRSYNKLKEVAPQRARSIRQDLQGKAFTASFVVPILGGVAQEAFGDKNQTRRGLGAAAAGAANVTGFAATGFAVAGPAGGAIGLAAGLGLELPKIIKAFSDTLPDLERRLGELRDTSQKTAASLEGFIGSSEKLNESFIKGGITVGQQDVLRRQAQASLSQIPDVSGRQRIIDLIGKNDFTEARITAANITQNQSALQNVISQRAQFTNFRRKIFGFSSEGLSEEDKVLSTRLRNARNALTQLESPSAQANTIFGFGSSLSSRRGSREEIATARAQLKSFQENFFTSSDFIKSFEALAGNLFSIQDASGNNFADTFLNNDVFGGAKDINEAAKNIREAFRGQVDDSGFKIIDEFAASLESRAAAFGKGSPELDLFFERIQQIFDPETFRELKASFELATASGAKTNQTLFQLSRKLLETQRSFSLVNAEIERENIRSLAEQLSRIDVGRIRREAAGQASLIQRPGEGLSSAIKFENDQVNIVERAGLEREKLSKSTGANIARAITEYQEKFSNNVFQSTKNTFKRTPERIDKRIQGLTSASQNVFALTDRIRNGEPVTESFIEEAEKIVNQTAGTLESFSNLGALGPQVVNLRRKSLESASALGIDPTQVYDQAFKDLVSRFSLSDAFNENELDQLKYISEEESQSLNAEGQSVITPIKELSGLVSGLLDNYRKTFESINNQVLNDQIQSREQFGADIDLIGARRARERQIRLGSATLRATSANKQNEIELGFAGQSSRNILTGEAEVRRIQQVTSIIENLRSQGRGSGFNLQDNSESNFETDLQRRIDNQRSLIEELNSAGEGVFDPRDINTEKDTLDLLLRAQDQYNAFKEQEAIVIAKNIELTKRQLALSADRIAEQRRINEDTSRSDNPEQVVGNLGNTFFTTLDFDRSDFFNKISSDVADFGEELKGSFKQGFREAISGAENFGDAMKKVGLSISENILGKLSDLAIDNVFGLLSQGGRSLFNVQRPPQGAMSGGLIKKYARGGMVTGGSGVRDDVPALLSGGEFVLNSRATRSLGPEFLNNINKYASGGVVTDSIDKSSNSVRIRLANAFKGIGGTEERPESGELVVSRLLSVLGQTDTGNPQNQLKDARRRYFIDKTEYDRQIKARLDQFENEKRNRRYAAYISTSLSVGTSALGGIGGGGGAAAGSAINTGSQGFISSRQVNQINQDRINYPSNFNQYRFNDAGLSLYAFNGGLIPRRYNNGGNVFGGDTYRDNIPALLAGGEFVVNSRSAQNIGVERLNYMNQTGRVPGFINGGSVGGPAGGRISDMGDMYRYFTELIDISEQIRDNIASQPQSEGNSPQTRNSDVIINVSTNIAFNGNNRDGTVTNTDVSSNNGSNGSGGNLSEQDAKQLSNIINQQVTQTLVKETRIGGILDGIYKKK